jgi:uncharacterized tellurite resistance protein B-like protein
MALRRFLGGGDGGRDRPTWSVTPAGPAVDPGDTETVRRIVGELEALPPDRARYLAAFAYILTRAAAADLDISDVEMRVIEDLVVEHGGLSEAQAVLVAQMARNQSLLFGATEDYLVTRQFRELSTDEQRLELLRCCFAIGAADGTITADEAGTINEIARELDVEPADVNAVRAEFHEQLSAVQALRRAGA